METRLLKALFSWLGTILISFIFSGTLHGQFEQKLSLNISAGYFNTVGWNGHEDNWEEHGPSLMPNFTGGVAVNAGLQYNFSRSFSLEFQLGYRFAPGWYFDASPEYEDPFNYLHYEVYDDVSGILYDEGDNYMDMTNIHMGLAPRFYFLPGKRFNPFIYAGVSLNYTDVYFENNEYTAHVSQNKLDLYQENYDLINWFEYQVGVGFLAGAGVEFSINDNWGLFFVASYHFIQLRESAFLKNSFLMHYHDLDIQLGTRISVFKSKEL